VPVPAFPWLVPCINGNIGNIMSFVLQPENFISWVHFGDLHIRGACDENYEDFLELIQHANENLAAKVDFAFLPGDNADDGTEAQYKLVRSAVKQLKIPVHVITGDHDKKSGSLRPFQQSLKPSLYHALDLKNFRLLFLNAMDGKGPDAFDLGPAQIQWLQTELEQARAAQLRPLIFHHLYPSELQSQADTLTRLIREFQVELVEMGHTHYNELANDGRTIYAATRSTGQIEEGPPGFSITTIDESVISWKFKERGPWPFTMITSPADEKLITRPGDPRHVIRGVVPVRARVWNRVPVSAVTCSIDGAPEQPMQQLAGDHWQFDWDSRSTGDGTRSISVRVHSGGSNEAIDTISVLVNQSGYYVVPEKSVIDYENAIGAYRAKGILGTQLGPNENGTRGPWPSWR
jgi:predicted phosphodiesterase